ncbi:hypothetical protein AALO_G00059990 [Alosa alosa]|uniref:SWIM-type domain-containing protein n=1 Tax=Alosa alosa TaxID=278164 RepID=A0AAV6HBF5_9TELE|nr:uncharacterized protein LOC125293795 [Alosa alosa]XP_048097880.1 uncharacterized protein LOC125293795 [Alosa alosa]KAG5282791.1 hypothetical protein AALO_G00059990 [Alosa alosa]
MMNNHTYAVLSLQTDSDIDTSRQSGRPICSGPESTNLDDYPQLKIEEKKFTVKGSTETYVVDMELELCSCLIGQTGAPFKHQAAVAKTYNCLSNSFLPSTAESRAELLKLTSGEAVSLEFLQPLKIPSQSHKATPEPSNGPMQQLSESGLTLLQPQTSSADADWLQEDITQSPDMSLVEDMFNDLKSQSQDPIFAAGLRAMAKQYLQLKANPSKLLSALHSFGKSGSLASRRAATLRRAARRQSPMIGCQPTAVARRKGGTGSRRRQSAGRPKSHNLSISVASNVSHAKKHY